ncbi:hypothetical protein JTE90_001452 [Oedothorax gibbosus]|uniref:Uncharacterized protein n=1 Tax=Oedothorax gibbosus TaxID=931172 RepID=A0AAV6TUH6_9ARAC|nr:hypothetical protein JTE90_001452 [Oedothorax gibbosus]
MKNQGAKKLKPPGAPPSHAQFLVFPRIVCDLGTVRTQGQGTTQNQPPKRSVRDLPRLRRIHRQDFAIAKASEGWGPKNEKYSACRAHCPGNCNTKKKVCPIIASWINANEDTSGEPRGDCIKLEECPSKEIPKRGRRF